MALAIALAVIGSVTFAGPAAAHHLDVEASVVCGDTPDTWDVTWTVRNWQDPDPANTATVTASSRPVVAVGGTFAPGQARTFTETVSATTPLTLQVSFRWANGNAGSATGSAAGFPDCAPVLVDVTAAAPSVTPATCTTDGTLVVPADTAEVSYTQTPDGSGPGTYVVTATAGPGHQLVGTATWTLTVPDRSSVLDCLVDVRPVAPKVKAVGDCDTTGSVTMAVTEGVRYVLTRGNGRTGAYEVTASALPGYALVAGARTVFSGDLGERVACETGTDGDPATPDTAVPPKTQPPKTQPPKTQPPVKQNPPVTTTGNPVTGFPTTGTPTTTVSAPPVLPATGADENLMALSATGLGLLLAGGTMLLVSRRRVPCRGLAG
ncbi:LPXTG cell wall anchor domain-containing protein [Nocardioides pacificus]